jgi:hypothetical protein
MIVDSSVLDALAKAAEEEKGRYERRKAVLQRIR